MQTERGWGQREPSKALSLREIQLAALEVLKAIDRICRDEGLRYWLWYGSLIGAVRHQGFIPWDDDLDVAMPRRDYENLLIYFDEHAGELLPMAPINDRGNEGVPFRITRIVDTTYRMSGELCDADERMGAFVDIYPLDGAGDSAAQAHALRSRAYRAGQRFVHAKNFEVLDKSSSRVKSALKVLRSSMLGNPERYSRQLKDACLKCAFEDSSYVAVLSWVEGRRSPVYERSWFDATREIDFEGVQAPIPAGYDEILKACYGDYMTLPVEAQRKPHHSYQLYRRNADGGKSEEAEGKGSE